jgi:DNA-binding transcriptional ArsR family regulator
MVEESLLLQALGDTTKLRIIDFLADNRLFDYSQKDIIEGAGVSKKSFYDNLPSLEALGVVKRTRNVGKAKLYKLNEASPVVKRLLAFEMELIRAASEKHAVEKITARQR